MDLTANLLEADPSPLSEQRIYTTGYEGREVTLLPGFVKTVRRRSDRYSFFTAGETHKGAEGLFKTTAQEKIPPRPYPREQSSE
jgi:hypothetical protein